MTFDELKPGTLLRFSNSTDEFLFLVTSKNENNVFYIESVKDRTYNEISTEKEHWDDEENFIYAKAKKTNVPSHKHRFIIQILDGDLA
jgi:hypothetical protein